MRALLLTGVAALVVAGCGGGGTGTASAPASTAAARSTPSITISGFKFSPAALTVRPGASVVVANSDGVAHTVTADDGKAFDSGVVDPGSSARIRVAHAGRFAYHCTIHPYMTGVLVAR